MALESGSRLGSYEVLTLLGRGGMGEVYRARDLKLHREVAIKVLPDHLVRDGERLARLRREAQVLAALNHPHIAQIYGLEDSSGVPALVLELVEGPTLADRITAAPLHTREALVMARQIAEALEAAHEKSVIHRDLKPANIKLTPNGAVKVLDFGLAKAFSAETPTADLSLATAEATGDGLVVGTAAYMSPEQARGQSVDRRTDVWAFGCVLFEMFARRRAFDGDTLSDILASVLTAEPDVTALPATVPSGVIRLIRRCLEKDLRRRLRDIGDARLEIEDALEAPGRESIPAASSPGVTRRTAIGTLIGAAAGAAAMGAYTVGRDRTAGRREVMRFTIPLPAGHSVTSSFLSRIALSPDGRHIACNAAFTNELSSERIAAKRSGMIIRSIGELEWKPLGEGISPGSPFFSSDGQWVGIVQITEGQRLRKFAVSGGAPATLAAFSDSQPSGASWASNDVIYFVASTPGGIMRVPGQGGDPVEVCPIDFANGERTHRTPHALPGGGAVVFAVAMSESESADDASIVVFSAKTGQRKVLVEGGLYPRYSPSGHVVYGRNGTLFALPFDADRLEATGQPFAVLEGVMMSRNTGVANFDISSSGDLLYVPGKADGGARTLHWVDRAGRAEKLPLPPRSYLHPRISPDGGRLAIEVEGSSHDVFVYDFTSGVLANFTADGISHRPIWSSDGKRIGYRSGPMGKFQLFQMPSDRSARAQRVETPARSASTESYDPAGSALAYTDISYGGLSKIMVTSLDGRMQPQPLDDTRYAQGSPKFSPDGRWLAYCTNESGRPEVYVKGFPTGAKIQISNDGGNDPVWRRDGRELFYRNGDRMLSVPISMSKTFTAGRAEELWRGPYSHGMSSSCGAPGLSSSNYDVTPDGTRFLMIADTDDMTTSSDRMVLVVGFADALARQSA